MVQRLEAVMTTLNNYIREGGDSRLASFSFVLDALTDEVIEELATKDAASLAAYMELMGEVVAWIGHGDNQRLPEPVRAFAGVPLEIEASEV